MEGTTVRPGLGRVVVGVDGSPPACTALMWAAAEAALRGSTLCLVHATGTDTPAPFLAQVEIARNRQAGRELLDRTAEAITARHPELTVVTELTDGGAPAGLRRAAALTGTIVVGHRGLGGFSSLLLGSVGLEVAAAATTPVVVVRGTAEPVEAGVVLAAVRDEADVGCARAAAREALLRKVPLRLLHIWSAGLSARSRAVLHNGDDEIAGDHVRVMASVSDRVREEFPGLTVHADGQEGRSVPGALVDASHQADLLVVGGRRSPGYLGPTIGQTTLSLLQHAHCPVEIIPRQGPGHGSTS
ncbi:universal stress protein [Streptomyces gardneri]|uniref:universal stress protein n=1 Tax=Streptomyces gardneri TaxID=66892 RepID=UPI0006E2B8F6|nr:universal stress protein [Streptomyces gardneri]QPK49279.1 universal stress protein [Streptomyces gardneri]WRK40795.1 universal stress protein [Streptomyces venezuelae]